MTGKIRIAAWHLLGVLLLGWSSAAYAGAFAGNAIQVSDDLQRSVVLARPAQRVISLSPHITELVYAAGGGEQLVAAVEFSNYPLPARQLPRVGSGFQLDLEAIVAHQPDLIIAWHSGNGRGQLAQLEKLGISVYYSEPQTLQHIGNNLRDIGRLLGTDAIASAQAEKFSAALQRLQQRYRNQPAVSVFYQVWNRPLFTVNGQHLISHLIELCGGRNVFADLPVLSPQIDLEAVLAKNPQVIIAGVGEGRSDWLQEWQRWPFLRAVKNQQVYGINADLIVRHTPRIVQGAEQMCEALQQARERYSEKQVD